MATGQTRGSLTLYGDVKINQADAGTYKLTSVTVVLYVSGGATMIGRVTVPINGRYRFNNIPSGEYELAVEAEMAEIARMHVSVAGRPGSDFQQDLELALKPLGKDTKPKASTVSADELYHRTAANQSLFEKAQTSLDAKKYADAISHLTEVVKRDEQDFQAWTELGTAYLLSGKKSEAEETYQHALKVRPNFKLALLNLGRLQLEQKKYEESIATLSQLVQLDPESADGNLFLGEAYIQIKKGSKAVGYLNEAARLGRPDAHLWLATLYDAAKLKDRAAAEYEQFLLKKPDYPERQKLEKYIAENKKN
jgi:tetratricopeptide (TPR) repeat protein